MSTRESAADPAASSSEEVTDATPARHRPAPEVVADVVVTVLLLALFGWAVLQTAQWSFRAALFPRIVTTAAVVLTVLHLVQCLLRLWRDRAPTAVGGTSGGASDDEDDADDVEYVFRTAGPRRWASALGWVAGFFVLLAVTGLYVTAPVFSLLYLRYAAKRTWIFSAIYAIVIAVVLYVAFELALGVPTPTGLLLD